MVNLPPLTAVMWMVIVSWVLAFTLDTLDGSRLLTPCFLSSVQGVQGEEESICSRLTEPSDGSKRFLRNQGGHPGH